MKDKYRNIIDSPYPNYDWDFLQKHPRMAIKDRAKIFSPFAALSGHEDSINERQKITEEKEELLEDSRTELNDVLQQVGAILAAGEKPSVTATYFVEDKKEQNLHLTPAAIRRMIANPINKNKRQGKYLQIKGIVTKLDLNTNTLQILEEKIPLENIRALALD